MSNHALVFIYGSLRRGRKHANLLAPAEFLSTAATRAAFRRIRYQEGYPALAPGTQSVQGELYRVPASLLVQLDAFEEVPELYQRTEIELQDGSLVWAYTVSQEMALLYPEAYEERDEERSYSTSQK